jgi:hypothetical protein
MEGSVAVDGSREMAGRAAGASRESAEHATSSSAKAGPTMAGFIHAILPSLGPNERLAEVGHNAPALDALLARLERSFGRAVQLIE